MRDLVGAIAILREAVAVIIEEIVVISKAITSILTMLLFIATSPLVFTYLFYRYRLEAKLRKERKI